MAHIYIYIYIMYLGRAWHKVDDGKLVFTMATLQPTHGRTMVAAMCCHAVTGPDAHYEPVRGPCACHAVLNEADRIGAADLLGHFLAQLHAIGADEAHQFGAQTDGLGRLSFARHESQARTHLECLAAEGLIDDLEPLVMVIEDVRSVRTPRFTALVHGDLYARHLLFNAQGRLSGVIDWGDVHIGDPAVDLAIAHSFLPPAARDPFRSAYGPIDEETWQLARFRALYHISYGRPVGLCT